MKIFRRVIACVSAAAITACLSCFNAFAADDVNSFNDLRSAGRYIRECMKNRQDEVVFEIPSSFDTSEAVETIMRISFEETYDGSEGDYLMKNISYYGFNSYRLGNIKNITMNFEYRTTAEQEKYVDEKTAEILESLDIDDLDDYGKISAIYDYVINNVEYAYSSDMLRYTAYGALTNGEAVCQGITLLFYRLAKDAGVSCRMITGTSRGNHVWNIVSINGVYYLLDATWDIDYTDISQCDYFLKGTLDFDESDPDMPHIFDNTEDAPHEIDYTSEKFKAMYPISDVSYDPASPAVGYVLADVDSDGIIDSNDASRILSAYAMLSTGNTSGLSDGHERASDVNRDGMIDSTDASLVLGYYAYVSTGGTLSFEEYNK